MVVEMMIASIFIFSVVKGAVLLDMLQSIY